MCLYKKEKIGNKCRISICGIKFSYKLKSPAKNNDNFINYMVDKHNPEAIRGILENMFYERVGYFPDLDNPQNFNEKIHWLKLNYHNPLITTCCDKFAVKEYVKSKVGDGYTIPVIASWNKVSDIDFDALPNQFVLKVNWSSGYNIIVKDKSTLNIDETKAKLNQWMQPWNNSYYASFNWGYKNMKPVIYAEEYVEQIDGQLYDYKFFCFNGEPKMVLVVSDRLQNKDIAKTFFDTDWKRLPFKRPKTKKIKSFPKPSGYEKMLAIAKGLSKPFPFVRVDFYEIEDQIKIGELTFYSGGGFERFEPQEWDYKVGQWLKLN